MESKIFESFGDLRIKPSNNVDIGNKTPSADLRTIASRKGMAVTSKEFALLMDDQDPLREFRKEFCIPLKSTLPKVRSNKINDRPQQSINNNVEQDEENYKEAVYLCGNSLGLKPTEADTNVMKQLTKWADMGVDMHFEEPLPAAKCDRYNRDLLGTLVGAEDNSVTLMNGLTVNLHLMMLSFYQPSQHRYKILMEAHAFPSDRYAMVSLVEMKGYDPDEALIQLKPRPGEELLRHEDIIQILEKEGSSIAVVCLSGIQYYTGQKFDMKSITEAAQKEGCLVGWDLAHAIGNIEIRLDHWNVDFAVWCSYKYLNGGPGCIAGAYVNKRHNNRHSTVPGSQLKGWWSNKEETRFKMAEICDTADGVSGFRMSNPPVLLVAIMETSLKIFKEATMERILRKQRLITGYLELLLKEYFGEDSQRRGPTVNIITSENPEERGSQLSVSFSSSLDRVHGELSKRGVVCDVRQPNVMRLAPAPLYNSFVDVYRFIAIIRHLFESVDVDTALREG